MKPRAAGRNPGTPIPHFATLTRATSAAAQCRGPGGTARGRNYDESHRDRDAALRRGLAQLQLRQAHDRRRHRRLERIRRGLWLARRHGGDRAARRYQLVRRSPDLLVNGIRVPIVWTDWAVPWFLCPGCSRRCRHLYVPEFTCRICCHLDYSSRHVSRTVPGLHRITWLRRLISVDQRPFAPIPGRPRSHTRYNRIAAEIRLLEHGLVGYLAGVNRDLQRRILVRKSKGKW